VVSSIPRGGARAGKSGAKYTNRFDLPGTTKGPNGEVVRPGRTLPIAAAPGQPYGVAGQQLDAQRIVGLASSGTPVPPSGDAAGPGVGGGSSSPSPAPGPPSLALPSNGIQPGELPPLHAPTDRPNEPITAGAASGLGPGPEVLSSQPSPMQGADQPTISMFLSHLAAQPGAPSEMVALAQIAQSRG
jgi:hypothetical protein